MYDDDIKIIIFLAVFLVLALGAAGVFKRRKTGQTHYHPPRNDAEEG